MDSTRISKSMKIKIKNYRNLIPFACLDCSFFVFWIFVLSNLLPLSLSRHYYYCFNVFRLVFKCGNFFLMPSVVNFSTDSYKKRKHQTGATSWRKHHHNRLKRCWSKWSRAFRSLSFTHIPNWNGAHTVRTVQSMIEKINDSVAKKTRRTKKLLLAMCVLKQKRTWRRRRRREKTFRGNEFAVSF